MIKNQKKNRNFFIYFFIYLFKKIENLFNSLLKIFVGVISHIPQFILHTMIDLKDFLQKEINKFVYDEKNSQITISFSNFENYHFSGLITKVVMFGKKNLLELFLAENNNVNKIFTYQFTDTGTANFLSFSIKNEHLFNGILNNFYNKILSNDTFNLIERTNFSKKVLFDYSSPNMAKDMHVGHLRSTIIGDSLANIYEFVGHNVSRVNHLGDFGLPFGMIVEFVISNKLQITKDTSLQEIYIDSKNCFDSDDQFKINSYLRTTQLQSKSDPNVCFVWNSIYEHSLNSYKEIYNLLQISPNLEIKGESYYEKYIGQVKKELESKNLIKIDENNRTIVKTTSLIPMIYEKSEEKFSGYTYDTTDIVTLWYRTMMINQDEIYYVVDNGQSLHFKQLFEIGNQMNWINDTKKVNHLQFGIVTIGKKRLASRIGNTPKLIDLIEKGKIYTKNYFLQKHSSESIDDSTIEKVTIGSIKYFDLSKCRTTDYQFCFEQMLRPDGNTFVYLTYTIARCRGIIDKLKTNNLNLTDLPDSLDFSKLEFLDFKLLKKISEYPTMINNILKTNMTHHMCDYLYKLSEIFHESYSKTRTINFDPDNKIINYNESRIACYLMILHIFKKSFELLGLPCVDKI